MKTASEGNRGFTLIELMVVVSMVLIVLAWGVPNLLHSMEKKGIRKSLFDLTEGCEQARALAILTGEPTELLIRAEDGRMIIRKNAAPHLVRHETYRDMDPDEESRKTGSRGQAITGRLTRFDRSLGSNVAFEVFLVNRLDQTQYTEGLIRFHPNGTSDDCTLKLLHVDEDGRTERRWIRISPVTGVPRITEEEDR